MNEKGSLLEIIAKHKDEFVPKLDNKINTLLDLHLPECLIYSKNLSIKELYDELCLHAYAHYRVVRDINVELYAKYILDLEYKFRNQPLPDDIEVTDEILEKTYTPLAKKMISKQFLEQFSGRLTKDFFNKLASVADYEGIQYLKKYLPQNKLPVIEKPRLNDERRKIEHLFILRASELTKYVRDNRGKLIRQPRKRDYYQFCKWCQKEFMKELGSVFHYETLAEPMFNPANGCGLYYYEGEELIGVRMVKTSMKSNRVEVFFVCSKICYDALGQHLRRHPLPN